MTFHKPFGYENCHPSSSLMSRMAPQTPHRFSTFSKVKNMVYRGLDQDGNAGVVFERMAQVLLRCGQAKFKLQNLNFHMYWYH